MLSDSEIDALAAERDRLTLNSRQRTVYGKADYSRKGICGEIALFEFFHVDRKPRNNPDGRGDGGVDLEVALLDRNDKWQMMTVDVKTASIPKELWVEEGKANADVYVLARYDDETRRATCYRWQWGNVVRAAPVKRDGKLHHWIPAGECLPMAALADRYAPLIHYCRCGAWGSFGIGVSLRRGEMGQWFCSKHRP